MTLTLWDILTPRRLRKARGRKTPPKPVVEVKRPPARRADSPALRRYETMQREMLARYGVRVRKWRTSTSGVAWQITYADGTIARLIESPRPRGPVSAAVFLHEIGHHAIGFGVYRPRCLEELQAWCFSLDEMEKWDIAITDRVRKRVHESLVYAVDKAKRRGLKRLPVPLAPYAASDRSRLGPWADPRTSEASGPS
jgi:hypothetical protein